MVAWSSSRVWAAERIIIAKWKGFGELLLAMQQPARVFIVPGLGNSGPDHWQTYFERQRPDFTRIAARGGPGWRRRSVACLCPAQKWA
ncbi:alpha/beta hydrolase [Hymenobacter frigidus]|uniref:alpha/beta hydrolase n=1 Tax=Hymenobacter frigidus TaxID=1524095 RepID=UPI00357121CD